MSLTWKDAAATLLVGAVGIIAYTKIKGTSWPLLGSWRTSTLALLVLGLTTCIIVGSGFVPSKNGWTSIATVLGVAAFIFAIAGLVVNSKLIFLSLAADIFALWAVTTLHHVITPGV